MISPSMSRAVKVLLASTAVVALAAIATACGTENVKVQPAQGSTFTGAVLFNQRCSGCHTLSYAATHGSAAKVQTAQFNNGPNFDVRCERPVTRVLYAIENGGFSGAIMPQNIVVGQDAIDVAKFVATYAGRQAPKVPGVLACKAQPIGSLPAPGSTSTTSTTATTSTTPTTSTTATTKAKTTAHGKTVKPARKKKRKP
jgi:mono/diheme cytochrome c family protein